MEINKIEHVIGTALGIIDTPEQYRVRKFLEDAINACQSIRNEFDI